MNETNNSNHIINMSETINEMNNDELTKTLSDNCYNLSKDEFINKYIYKIMMPYIIFLKLILSDDNVYKKFRRNQKKFNQEDLNKINLYFLMEIIKKQIETGNNLN